MGAARFFCLPFLALGLIPTNSVNLHLLLLQTRLGATTCRRCETCLLPPCLHRPFLPVALHHLLTMHQVRLSGYQKRNFAEVTDLVDSGTAHALQTEQSCFLHDQNEESNSFVCVQFIITSFPSFHKPVNVFLHLPILSEEIGLQPLLSRERGKSRV